MHPSIASRPPLLDIIKRVAVSSMTSTDTRCRYGQVRITGGGARSPLWRQILADVLGAEIATVNAEEGAAYGAALLAATGAGVWSNVAEACAATIRVTGVTAVDEGQIGRYDALYTVYRDLYPALQPSFAQISTINSLLRQDDKAPKSDIQNPKSSS
ncbi:MAG: FGGY-family carbohydrate kinase [Anaerolineae bacterium]|nr:FGGY-family carbohydrate kinase [Anaerolineae bacterium]